MSKSSLWATAKIPGIELSKEELEACLRSSDKGFALLASLLEDKLRACNKLRSERDGYDSPSWAYKQADFNGEERALRSVLDILKPLCYNSHT